MAKQPLLLWTFAATCVLSSTAQTLDDTQCLGPSDPSSLLQLGEHVRHAAGSETPPALLKADTSAALESHASRSALPAYAEDGFFEHMQSVVDEYSSQAHAAVDDAQTKLDGLLAQLHSPATHVESAAFASSAVAATKTVVETATAARRLASDFADQIGTAEVEVRALSERMETIGGSDWQQLDAQRKPAVAFLAELLLGSAVLMGISVEELESWFDHSLSSTAEVQAGSFTWPQLVAALLAQAPAEAQAPDAAHRALHAAAAGRAAVVVFTGRLDAALAATASSLADAGHPAAGEMPKSAHAAQQLAASTRQIAAVLLGDDVGASTAAQPVLSAVPPLALTATAHSVGQPRTDALVSRVHDLVEQYTEVRAAVADARATLEGLQAANRSADGLADNDRATELNRADAIMYSARAARGLASEIKEQIAAARSELWDISDKLEGVLSKEEELALAARMQPAEVFLEVLLKGAAVLLNSSAVELQGFYVRTLASRNGELASHRGTSWEWPAFASSGLLLVDIAPDSTRKALDVASAAIVMLGAFMTEVDTALAETSAILGRLPSSSGSSRAALDQELIAAALRVARVLEINFVVEEAARSTAGVLARTELPVLMAIAAVFAGRQT